MITVKVVDTKSGKPVPHREIWVDRIDPDTHIPIVERGFPLKGSTGVDGIASFSTARLRSTYSAGKSDNRNDAEAAPRKRLSKFLDIEITYAAGGIQCSTGLFSLEEILTSGVVGDNRCDKKFDPGEFKSIPGEVIIFVGKYHWWEAGQT
ncbi:MAG: hypothetical protein ACLQMO_14975 [Acidobacteriaceae bacterium]